MRNKGFTLIELLVVVLIIGILAAIAFPQYEIAVQTSKVKRIMPVMKNVALAQERARLSGDGSYPFRFADLDISLPCTKLVEGDYYEHCYLEGAAPNGRIAIYNTGTVQYISGIGNTLRLVLPNNWMCLAYYPQDAHGGIKERLNKVCNSAGFTSYYGSYDSGTGSIGEWFQPE